MTEDVRIVASRSRRGRPPSHLGPAGPFGRLLRKLLAYLNWLLGMTRPLLAAGTARAAAARAVLDQKVDERRRAKVRTDDGAGWAAPAGPPTPPPPEGPRPRLFDHARPVEIQERRALLHQAGRVVGGGLAGMLALLLVAGLFLPAAARSATRSMALGIAPAEQVRLSNLSQRSVVLAGDGSVLAVLHDEIDRKVVPLDAIPEHVRQAVLTAEDRKFYDHGGYDVEGIGRAVVANLRAGTIEEGGSTITQQIAKSVVGDEQSMERKLNELAYAVALEREYTKDELLARYLNQVYFGTGAYGIAAASEQYFGQPDPSQLRVEQGALLAGLIRSPGSLDPRKHPEDALQRRNQVLSDMGAEGYLDPQLVGFLQQTPLGVVPPSEDAPVDPYLTAAVQQEFLANTTFGVDRAARTELLFGGGLKIETSVDPRLQQIARDVVTSTLRSPTGPTAAIATVDPRDGRILAIYGGADFNQEQFNLATQGRRQPGSSFKPFVMATALEEGFPLSLQLEGDSPLRIPNAGSPEWETEGVSNYGGSDYGRVDLRTALIKSVNTAFAQLMVIVGTEPVLDTAGRMGINIEAATAGIANPSIALGGLEHGVTPLEMASAYGTFANNGSHVAPALISRVTDPDGTVLYERTTHAEQVLDPGVNATMVETMKGVVTSGTGTRARLTAWTAAGKTGTTQRNADAWFVGYTPVMSTAVWMGYPQGQIPMPGRTGGSIPAGIWQTYMTAALDGIEPVAFPDVPATERSLAGFGPTTVPAVTGMNATEALRALAEAHLLGEVRTVGSRSPIGTVVSQSPRAGSYADSGDEVSISVSSGQGAEPDRKPGRGGGHGGGNGGGGGGGGGGGTDLQGRAKPD